MDDLIAAIVSRTRDHPHIRRGASVRGAIAFKEVLQGFTEIQDGLTSSSIKKAALITLAPRISTKQGDYESAVAIINDIVKEVLYGNQLSKAKDETVLLENMGLSPEEIMRGLQNSKQISQEQKSELAQEGRIAIIPSTDFPQEGNGNQYSSPKKAIGYLMKELEQRLIRGEITQDEYNREKNRLKEMLRAASQPQYTMTSKELAETVMELMEAQDRHWQKEVNFEQMYIYYHMKATSEGRELSPSKRDYDGLRTLIDDLEKQGILRAVTPERSFTLTGEALNTLLEYLITKVRRSRRLQSTKDFAKAQANERKHDIKRYSLGDVFRDISVRHTLREVVRQKKNLSEINRRDFRVFMKQHRKLQSNIVLCLDTSGSMRYQHNLAYARLAAAGLARAAAENGDRVGIITFDNFGRTVIPLTSSNKETIDYIASISARGNTNIGDGIKCATQLLLREPAHTQKHIVLVTDGQPTAILEKALNQLKPTKGKDLTEEYAILETRKASSSGVKVSVIHITNGKELGEEFVKNIAKVGKGQVQKISSLEDIRTIMQQQIKS